MEPDKQYRERSDLIISHLLKYVNVSRTEKKKKSKENLGLGGSRTQERMSFIHMN